MRVKGHMETASSFSLMLWCLWRGKNVKRQQQLLDGFFPWQFFFFKKELMSAESWSRKERNHLSAEETSKMSVDLCHVESPPLTLYIWWRHNQAHKKHVPLLNAGQTYQFTILTTSEGLEFVKTLKGVEFMPINFVIRKKSRFVLPLRRCNWFEG